MTSSNETILLVDDDPQVREVYNEFLADTYEVQTASDGEPALEKMHDDIDLVLLDRRMPGVSGDEVLTEIRARGYDCPVIMVTAVYPTFDIITMSFNDYLIKPISRDALRETVERALALSERDIQIQEYFALVAKKRALETEKEPAELNANDEYADLTAQIEQLRERVTPPINEFEEDLAESLSEDKDNKIHSRAGSMK